jgi:hypothetical protein
VACCCMRFVTCCINFVSDWTILVSSAGTRRPKNLVCTIKYSEEIGRDAMKILIKVGGNIAVLLLAVSKFGFWFLFTLSFLFHFTAYATVDQKEFFAEMMVTYLSDAYHELDGADSTIMEECTPVLLEPSVTERVLKKYGLEGEPLEPNEAPCGWLWDRKLHGARPKLRMVHPILQEHAIARSCIDTKHCNKFYPFTRGQLKHHDPDGYAAMQKLYMEIVLWDDLEDTRQACRSLKKLLPSW